MIEPEINKLASLIDLERDHQRSAVLWALTRFLEAKQRGVVLADEVGCGKTYEALAVLALLWHYYGNHNTEQPIRRVLILCKSSLLRKWYEELTAQPKEIFDKDSQGARVCSQKNKQGIRAYLTDGCWNDFNEKFIEKMYPIENLNRVNKLWSKKGGRILHGVNEGGKIQVPEGLYLVNQHLLYKGSRAKSKPLKYLYRTNWDVVIVDEAHHYGKGNKCDSIFADSDDFGNRNRTEFCVEGTLNYRHIMLLTATPFELDPGEMINLLRIARADDRDLEQLSLALRQYQLALNRFYELRMLPSNNERRCEIVKKLHHLRVGIDFSEKIDNHKKEYTWMKSFCPRPTNQGDGLEGILRRYIARNLKETKRIKSLFDDRSLEEIVRRDYSLANKDDHGWIKLKFDKFDDLKFICSKEPLIPFAGPDALFYLQLRELIQQVIEKRGRAWSFCCNGLAARPIFIPTTSSTFKRGKTKTS
jgi:SNF2 family DNA or RNA helicase